MYCGSMDHQLFNVISSIILFIFDFVFTSNIIITTKFNKFKDISELPTLAFNI